jgi:hypothetical protein
MENKKEQRESGEEKRVRISGQKEEMYRKMRIGNERGRFRDTQANEYEECCLLRFYTVWTGRSLPTFREENCSHLQR